MTVNTLSITSGPYAGNGVADTFSYLFRIQDKTQVTVFETDADGLETTPAVDTDYTVNGIGGDAGGTITRLAGPLPTGYEWYIRSNYIENQLTDFSSQGAFFPYVHEDQMDHITFTIQQISDRLARSLRVSDSYSGDELLALEDPQAGQALVWNADADGIVNGVSAADAVGASFKTEVQTATAGQIIFNLSAFTYVVNAGNLAVYLDGERQNPATYIETDPSTLTMLTGVALGVEVMFISADVVTTAVVLSGDVVSDGNAVSVLQPSAITGKPAITSGLESTDELLISDSGALKRMDVSVIQDYLDGKLDADTLDGAEGADYVLHTDTASEAVAGIVEQLTQTEVNTGTDTSRYPTIAKLLGGFSISKSSNGYIKMPIWLSGLIIQWGTKTSSGTAPNNASVVLPTAFTNAPLCAVATIVGSGASSGGNIYTCQVGTMTTTTLSATTLLGTTGAGSVQIRWFAIGH